MAKQVELSQRERAVIVLFCERYEGTKVEARRMDKALDVIDNGVVDFMVTTPMGVQMDMQALGDDEEEFIFENEPFKTLNVFLQSQTLPYSRRPDTVGRVMLGVLDKFDNAKTIDLGKKGKD